MNDVRTVTIGAVEHDITESDTVATLFDRFDGPLKVTPRNTKLCRPFSYPEPRPPRDDEVISWGLDELEDGDELELYRVSKTGRPAYDRRLVADGGRMTESAETGDPDFDQSSALTLEDDDWSTRYEVQSEEVSRLFRHLAHIRDWAVIEFHPEGITGRAFGKANVAAGRVGIPDSAIEQGGSHCKVAVNVASITEVDAGFLGEGDDATLEFEPEDATLRVSYEYHSHEFDLQLTAEYQGPDLPDPEYTTRADLKGWQFAGPVEGACAASFMGFELEAIMPNDLRISSRDSDFSYTIEGVLEESEFGSAMFSAGFFPDITDAIAPDSDVRLRSGDDLPMEITINDRTTYAVAPQIVVEDDE